MRARQKICLRALFCLDCPSLRVLFCLFCREFEMQVQPSKIHSGLQAFPAAISAGLAAHFCKLLKKQTAFGPKALLSIMATLSLAATGFLIYNLLAGGNPPKEDKAVTAAESMTPQKAY